MELHQFIRTHGIPVASGLILMGIGALAAFFLCPQPLLAMHFAMLPGGFSIGLLTPKGEIDHRGTNGIAAVVAIWCGYILFSSKIFPTELFISDWLYNLMLNNILNGFALIIGIYLGSKGQLAAIELAPEVLAYLRITPQKVSKSDTLAQWLENHDHPTP